MKWFTKLWLDPVWLYTFFLILNRAKYASFQLAGTVTSILIEVHPDGVSNIIG